MELIEQKQKAVSKNSQRIRPKIIKWKGERIIRNHSFLATVNEICEYSSEIDVVRVGIIGDMHSGKSTLSKAIGHSVHKKMEDKFKIPFALRILDQDDLSDFKNVLKHLEPANYVLVFDDVTFLEHDKGTMTTIKQAVTKIRHLEGGQDVKIILIYNYHYNLGFDKYLRQADFRYFLTVGSSETENMEKIIKTKNMPLVHKFINYRRSAIVKKRFSVQLTAKEFFTYKWRKPFIPVLFYNNDGLRLIVSPTREWLDPICSVCATASGVTSSEIPVDEFVSEGGLKFGERTFESAIKLLLFQNGLSVYARSVVQAKRWISRSLEKKQISFEQIMIHYGYKLTKTRLKKELSDLVDGKELKKVDTTKKGSIKKSAL